MITVCLNEANFEYDIHSLVKAFYGKEDVKVFADREKIQKLEQDETPLFRMEISYLYGAVPAEGAGAAGKGKDRIDIRLFLPPPAGEGHAAAGQDGYSLGAQRAAEADFSDRKEAKNILKRCLYRLLSEYTGQTLPWGTLTGIRPTKIAMSMLENGAGEGEVEEFMAGTYLASQQKIALSIEIAKREMRLLEPVGYQEGYSLYIGIPFCPSICSYCSFSSSPIKEWEGKVDGYLAALAKEMAFTADACAHKKLNSVYIGGGTPTTLSPQQMDFLLTEVENRFNLSDLVEYTVEAGRPDSIARDKLKVLRSHGISRISINPQTMKQETLDLIGRCHTVAQTVESFWLAREMGFDNINMDLIVGLPGETIEDVGHTMEQVAGLGPESLTVHSLAVKRAARLRMSPEEYQGMEMENTWGIIGLTAKYAREMGLLPYYLYRQKNMAGNFENVGYAAPGKAGLYNILMMEEKQSILALGAGAVTKYVFEPDKETGNVRVERTENVKNITQYMERIDEMIGRKRAGIEKYFQ
ncbi:MAG: coproporphyrinogen dehydrogenase HemZ [Lachnospiraceae bacterium]|jgi:coproporphyrinogen dehydrogenase HemZ|nr:coproporphyrinogen dehydrogenase HemZ [Lachnospiraceae bacterium]